MKYKSVIDVENILIKEKKSKFIGAAFHVLDEHMIKEKLEYIKHQLPKATHYCYAYRLGNTKDVYRANDDGEPNGTAGLPILHQIDSFGLTNTLIVVTRYYGGTKLGVSGLILAYKACAIETIQQTEIVEYTIYETIRIELTHQVANSFFNLLNQHKLRYSKDIEVDKIIFNVEIEPHQKNLLDNYL
jgi:uncharacterized YigZ family protein